MKQYPVPLSKSDLMSVESPARYVGGEFNAVIKEDMLEELEKTGKTSYVRFAFCFRTGICPIRCRLLARHRCLTGH